MNKWCGTSFIRMPHVFSCLFVFFVGSIPLKLWADSNINGTNRYAYTANAGWIDCRGDITNGAVVGQFFCSGYLYGANIGWIRLGDGSPDNGYSYANSSATDYGVNHDGIGNLRGYAWGANVGWINFETNGMPKVDLTTGRMNGYCYSANMGWIGLSNAQAHVRITSLDEGRDTDLDGIPDPYEHKYAGGAGLTYFNRGSDRDHDGVNDEDEYPAGTNPDDVGDYLAITDAAEAGGTNVSVTWWSKETRMYRIEKGDEPVDGASWSDSGMGLMAPDTGSHTTRELTDEIATQRTYRVKAVVPLSE